MKIKLSIFIASLLILVSCKQVNSYENVDIESTSKASVSFSIHSNQTRTVLPQNLGLNHFSFILTGRLNEGEIQLIGNWESFEKMNEAFASKIELETGVWEFSLNAYYNEKPGFYYNNLAQSAYEKITLSTGANFVRFSLKEVSDGNGKIDIKIVFPSTVERVTASLFSIENLPINGFQNTRLTISTDGENSSASYIKSSVPCGDYIIKFYLYQNWNDENPTNIKSEFVHVAPSNISKGELQVISLNFFNSIKYNLNCWAEGFIPPDRFNVNQKVSLPVQEDFDESIIFKGWYREGDETKTYVSEIPLGTTENQSFIADISLNVSAEKLDNILMQLPANYEIDVKISDRNPDLSLVGAAIQKHIYYSGNKYKYLRVNLDLSNCLDLLTIPASTFYNCTNLYQVYLPDSLKTIEGAAFNSCSFSEITLPSHLEKIEKNAFRGTNISSLVFPETLVELDPNAFNFERVKKIEFSTLNDNFINILPTQNIFEEIILKESVTEIPESFFTNIHHDTLVRIFNLNQNIADGLKKVITLVIDGDLTKIEDVSFPVGSYLQDLKIIASVTSIGDNVFSRCYDLYDIELPSSLLSIGNNTFYGRSIRTINFPENLSSIGDFNFKNLVMDKVEIKNLSYLGKGAFYQSQIKEIVIQGDLSEIQEETFYDCFLEKIVLPDSIEKIGQKAFFSCDKLFEINFPCSLISIDDYAFTSCGNLQYIELPNSISYIGSYAFSQTGIETLKLPEDLSSLNWNIFLGCRNLTELFIPSNVNEIICLNGLSGYNNCKIELTLQNFDLLPILKSREEVESLILDCNITSLPENTFSNTDEYNKIYWWSLKNLVLPESLLEIEPYAFKNILCESISFKDSNNWYYLDNEDDLLKEVDFSKSENNAEILLDSNLRFIKTIPSS